MIATAIDFTGDFKSKLNVVIDSLFANKSEMSRNQRIWAVQYYTDEYVRQTGERPEWNALDRLATLILDDEISDKTPYKIANTEYPIMGDRMFEERSDRNTQLVGLDYEADRKMTGRRRKRTKGEEAYVDNSAKIRNEERRKRYREFTKVQPVITYHISEL